MTCNNVVICRCIGKICMVDVIAYLCKDENLSRSFEALKTSVLDLVPKVKGQIRHLESNSRKALMILHMIWCDETITAAITTLSAGDLMAYLDYTGPPEDLVHLVNMRLRERDLTGMLDLMDDYYNPSFSSSSSSSDEEFGMGKNGGMGRSYPERRSEAIVCNPWNTLMAVMVQMIAHRVSYAWVVKEDYGLVGIVTFTDILRQLRGIAGSLNENNNNT